MLVEMVVVVGEVGMVVMMNVLVVVILVCLTFVKKYYNQFFDWQFKPIYRYVCVIHPRS